MNGFKKNIVLFSLLPFFLHANSSNACSRFTYTAPNNTVVTGRSMDWTENLHTDLWAFPAGITRNGHAGSNSVTWVSKYGSVIASGYNVSATDGINSKGLDVNMLYLSDASYGTPNPYRKNLSVFYWAQYILDNYATVNDAVKDFSKNQFNMIAPKLPNGDAATIHLAITDPSGDNAVFEYINGRLVIHHGKQFKVMTNEPSYDKQLALTEYWQNLKGSFLPGTSDPSDRFVRTTYYLSTAPQSSDIQQSVAIVFSIIRNVSVPMTAQVSSRPNIAATLWLSVADLKHGLYFFENTDRPNIFWVNIHKLNLSNSGKIEKLPLANNQNYDGEVSRYFVESACPF